MAFRHSVTAYVSALLLLVSICSGLAVGAGQYLDDRLMCRSLSPTNCAFAVDSYGARCVLETTTGEDGTRIYQCETSDIVGALVGGHIESQECVNACGVERMTVGISSDSFSVPGFVAKLCSVKCQKSCSNIVNLFSSIVASASEGASLDRFCNAFQRSQPLRRQLRAGKFSMSDLSVFVAPSPTSSGVAEGPSSSFSAQGPVPSFDDSPAPPPEPSAEAPELSAEAPKSSVEAPETSAEAPELGFGF